MVSPRYQSHVRGAGAVEIAVWLDYICPFSKKQFTRLNKQIIDDIEKRYPNKYRWVFQHQVQPWHAQGVWLHEAAIAVGLLAPSKFWDFSQVLFDNSEQYYDRETEGKSRTQIVEELAALAEQVGVAKADVLRALEIYGKSGESRITPDIKYYVKLGRQTGVHVSPSALINGLFANDVSSSWDIEEWDSKLGEQTKLFTTDI